MVVKCAMVDRIQVHIQIAISRYSYIDYSHKFVGRALARFERCTFQEHKGTKIVMLRFLKIITPLSESCPFMMAAFVAQGTESFIKDLEITLWSVNIDKSKGVSYKVFNYFGRHRLFDAGSVTVSTYKVTSTYHRRCMLTRLPYL